MARIRKNPRPDQERLDVMFALLNKEGFAFSAGYLSSVLSRVIRDELKPAQRARVIDDFERAVMYSTRPEF